jgi:hypothetical protein
VDDVRRYLAANPAVIAVACAFLAGYCTYWTFYSGLELGRLRGELGELAHAASEALGG